jgi:hypothetical protein
VPRKKFGFCSHRDRKKSVYAGKNQFIVCGMLLSRILPFFLLLAPAAVTGQLPGTRQISPVVASADPFVDQVQRSKAWLAFPGTNQGGWQLELRFPTNAFLLHEPIDAIVVFKNVSTNSLRLFVSTPAVPYMFSTAVLDASNQPVPLDDEAREHMEHGRADLGMFRDVPAGGSLGFPSELQHLYLFGRPGVYKVSATARWLPNAHWTPGPAPAEPSTAAASITLIAPKPPLNSK